MSKTNKFDIRLLFLTSGIDYIGRVFYSLTNRINEVFVIGEAENTVVSFSSFNGKEQMTRHSILRIRSAGERRFARYAMLVTFFGTLVIHLIFSKAVVCDVAVCHSAPYTILMKGFRKLGATRKIVFYAGEFFPIDGRGTRLERFLVRLSSHLDRVAWEWADSIWCNTHAKKRQIIGYLGASSAEKIRLIPPLFFPARDGNPDMNEPTIIYVGSIRSGLGIDIVLEAIATIRAKGKAPRLELVGAPINDEIIRQIEQHAVELGVDDLLIIRGPLEIKALQFSLQKAICGLAIFKGGTSNYSNSAYPGKVITYLENGLVALIGSDSVLTEHPELKDCCIFVKETPEAIAQAISFLMTQPEVAGRMGAAAYAYAQMCSRSERILQAIEELAKGG